MKWKGEIRELEKRGAKGNEKEERKVKVETRKLKKRETKESEKEKRKWKGEMKTGDEGNKGR